MSIDAAAAIEIGKKYGLDLSDIRALRDLADTEEAAEQYARDFSNHGEKVADDILKGNQ